MRSEEVLLFADCSDVYLSSLSNAFRRARIHRIQRHFVPFCPTGDWPDGQPGVKCKVLWINNLQHIWRQRQDFFAGVYENCETSETLAGLVSKNPAAGSAVRRWR